MSFLTKAFVVIVTVLSILLVAVTVSTVARYENLNNDIRALSDQLAAAEAAAELTDSEIQAIRAESTQQLAALEQQLGQRQDRIQSLQGQLADATSRARESQTQLQELKASVSTLSASTNTQAQLINALNGDLGQWRTTATDANRKNVELTDRVSELTGENDGLMRTVRRLREDMTAMHEELAQVEQAVQTLPEDLRPRFASGDAQAARPTAPANPIAGAVLDVQQQGQETFVQVNVGSSDGLAEGMELMLHRGDNYLGRMVVQSVDADTAVGRMVLTQAQVQQGDAVLAGAAF